MATTTQQPWTSDELCRLPAGWRYEIDEGKLVIMAPAGMEHGRVERHAARVIGSFVDAHRLGDVYTGEIGLRLKAGPEILRGADVAFVSHERLARIANRKGFSNVPPDLAVEVHDPSEPDLRRKIDQYIAAGVRAVWVLDPDERTLTRRAPDEEPHRWADPHAVVEEPVLPGFSCRLGELFGEA